MSPLNWDTAERLLATRKRSCFWADHERDLEDPEYREAFVHALSSMVAYRYRTVLDRLGEGPDGSEL